MRYNDEIYCAAGRVVLALQEEGQKLGFSLDEQQGGGYAALHVRRGDLQVSLIYLISSYLFVFVRTAPSSHSSSNHITTKSFSTKGSRFRLRSGMII